MLRVMAEMILVKIVGAPMACKDGIRESWREITEWAAGQLKIRYGETVRMQYYDLFDSECPQLPTDSQLPVVIVDGEVISMGGKLSVPLIRQKIDEIKFIRESRDYKA
jgi:disulfide oxidoreductase YuzD